MNTHSVEATLLNYFFLPSVKGSAQKKVEPFFEGIWCAGKKQKVTKVVFLVKMEQILPSTCISSLLKRSLS